jgi:hypothetical protein
MSRHFVRGTRLPLAAIVLWVVAVWALPAAAEPPTQDALIQAHIAAGEFAPAIALAEQAADPRQRDAWLAEIAAAQARAGNRDGSLRSAAEIGDDRVRADTLSTVAAVPLGGQGGGNEPDFESLIDLITSTVQPATWDTAGGPGSISKFPTGVYVDAQGVLKPLLKEELAGRLAALRAASGPRGGGDDARRNSPLRMVSLPRLEKQIQLLLAAGRQPTEDMQVLAGLQRIRYVFVYPESGDLVLAGPAGDWKPGPEDILVSSDTGGPVVRLDDLVVVLRLMTTGRDAQFGCLITPRPQALARVQAFVKQSSRRAISPAERKAWLEQVRAQLGKQDIEVYGLDPRTRAARVMVEADYRMKLVGMGLEQGVPGVQSYLASVVVPPGQSPPPLGVLRWWFTLNYDALGAAQDRQAFAVRGQGVKVEGENERLSAEGRQIHTGESDALNQKFARSFTEHFPELCQKYPIYAELRNIFDLALVCALLQQEGLPERVGWHLTCFGNPQAFAVELGEAPKEVDTVINYRIVNHVHILAGVSGGVKVQPAPLVDRQAIQLDRQGGLSKERTGAVPANRSGGNWWWD